MQLENTFTIPTGIEEAWQAFNDPSRFASCFPGATLQSYEGDSFVGTVKVKLGPISLTYKGTGTYLERNDAEHSVVIDATGRDTRGNGTASAKVTGTLTADGPTQTTVKMVTDMTVTGRPAQFGRGVMADVSDKIINQFAVCLAKKLGPDVGAGAGDPGSGPVSSESSAAVSSAVGSVGSVPAGGTVTTAAPAVAPSTNGASPRLVSAPEPAVSEVEAIDLLGSAGAPVLKRLAPVVLALLVLFMVLRRIKNR
ncbi:MAG: SRPBCC family protein [Actinomycetota bacterium]|nr:SRPBCC family protein [Actinomycetota bacterium]